MKKLQNFRIQLIEEFPDRAVRSRLSTIGYLPMLTKTSRGPGNLDALFVGSNMAEVALELAPSENRTISTEEIVRKWRSIMPEIPGAKELSFKSDLFSAGDPINIQLSSKYIDDLILAKDELKAQLVRFPGVFDVSDTYNIGKEELSIDLLPAAKLWSEYDDGCYSSKASFLWSRGANYTKRKRMN